LSKFVRNDRFEGAKQAFGASKVEVFDLLISAETLVIDEVLDTS
jgi:hypothetical protein